MTDRVDAKVSASSQVEGGTKAEPTKTKGRKRAPKKLEVTASLNVACLKRLLPIGLNMFGGREQELVQQAKQKLVDVSNNDECPMIFSNFNSFDCMSAP